MKKTALVFSHVHWDIEWYLPFRSFRFWLVKGLDRLIDPVAKQSGFKTFVFDGQVAPIDHYLEVRPENEKAIRGLVKSGKLSVGPFYTQYDEWLTGPEAIVRNCLYGNRRAREFGKVMKAGYLPDNFGHPVQMPQILAGFGLKSLIFMRGMPERSEEVGDQFHWVGLDGTRVLGIHMRQSYCNAHAVGSKTGAYWPPMFRAAAFGDYIQTPEFLHHGARETDMKKGVENLLAITKRAEPGCHTGVIPIANGYDSAVAQETIADLMALANKSQDEYEFVHGNCEDLTKAIQKRSGKLAEFKGELWGGKFVLLLTGAITTRSYLKQANFVSEALLERYAEPLSALASIDGAEWPALQLEEAWRWLFLNQAHDGIHGSSADPVHEEMVQRFNAARQIAVGLTHEALAALAARRDDAKEKGTLVLAYNPAGGVEEPAVVDTWLHGFDPAKHVVADERGRPLPVQVVANPWAADVHSEKVSWAPAWPDGNPAHVLVAAPIQAGGLAALRLAEAKPARLRALGKSSDTSIENEHLRVTFKKGTLDIYDKATRRTYAGLNVIEDDADRGDAWDFSAPWGDDSVLSSTDFPSECRLVEAGPVRSMLEITTRMRVPKRLEGEKRSREKVDLVLVAKVSLVLGARRVDVSLSFDNQACDHRLRLKTPTGLRNDTVTSQGHFGILKRPVRNPDEGKTGWTQPPPVTFHFREWVAVEEGGHGLAVAARGLYEYESKAGKTGLDLRVTLQRGYGRMGRSNFRTRPTATSPTIPTPGAQCLGTQTFDYAFIPYSAGGRGARAPFMPLASSFLYPPIAHQADPSHLLVEAAVLKKGTKGAVPTPAFKVGPANLRVSAFKRAAENDGWILRFWENEGKRTTARITLAPVWKKVVETNLNEETLRPVKVSGGRVSLEVEPYKIITLKLADR
jgi:mannosylglycerate hydrolase